MISKEDLLRKSIIDFIRDSSATYSDLAEVVDTLNKCWGVPDAERQIALQDNSVDFNTVVDLVINKPYFNSGCVALGSGEYDEAVDAFTKSGALFDRISAHMKQNNYSNAITDCELFLANNPHNAPAYAKLIMSLWLSGRHSEALQAHQRALENCPDDDSIKDMSFLLSQKG